MTTLQNKTALVTGASRGIGRATALALARAGAHVVVHYGRSAQEAESLVAEVQTKGGRATAISADLGTPDGSSLLAKQVRSIVGDRLDVLVLNAGISKAATIADYTVEDFDNLFATNVRGPFFLIQQLAPVLGEGSSVVVISSLGARSVVGKSGLETPSILAYASTKGALETLVKNWAAILGPSGIRVNAVAPGVISPMHEGGAFQSNAETLPVTEYAIEKLNSYNLSHLLLMGNTTDFSGTPLEKLAGDGMFQHFRPLYNGALIANVSMDRERGNRLIAEGLADLIAFGRPYIANPDLVQRFTEDAPLAEVDWETVYGSGERGYSDYPAYQLSQLTRS